MQLLRNVTSMHPPLPHLHQAEAHCCQSAPLRKPVGATGEAIARYQPLLQMRLAELALHIGWEAAVRTLRSTARSVSSAMSPSRSCFRMSSM